MKIRILGNSIRFRLKQPEVQRLAREGKLSEVMTFGIEPDEQISYSLEIYSGDELSVSLLNTDIKVSVPESIAANWINTDRVGFEAQIDTGKSKVIAVLVEKDFKCLDRSDEEEEGSYPNPNDKC